MTGYYDRNGNAITQEKWSPLFSDEKYRLVLYTEVNDEVHISTIWLGLDHNWGDGEPLIFESMVFGGYLDQTQKRYTTEEEAKAGHHTLVVACRLATEETASQPGLDPGQPA